MKSRKVKTYQAHKRVKPDLTLDESDSDVNPDTFFQDDIDDFNNEKDDQLSTDDELIQHKDDSSEEEEVLPITDDEKDESDEDDEDKDDDERNLPNREAWGRKKSTYYSADFVDEDRGKTYREEDAEAAKAEAEEAYAIQKSVYSNIRVDNLGATLFLEGSDESSGEEEKLDLTSATKEEKLMYLKKETKVLEIIKEYKSVIQEHKRFTILLDLVEKKKIRSKTLEHYIRTKNQILSLYCLNMCLYMMFVSSGKNPKYHPVLQKLTTFKGLLEELKPSDSVAAPFFDQILEKENRAEGIDFQTGSEGEDETIASVSDSLPKDSIKSAIEEKNIKKSKTKHVETETERQVMSLISEVKEEMRKRKHEESDDEEIMPEKRNETRGDNDENVDEKRTISYEIAKNKGLVPRRKKECRNPRVHNRQKFRKANIRRKGQVQKVIKETKQYEGVPTGINKNVIKSRKFK